MSISESPATGHYEAPPSAHQPILAFEKTDFREELIAGLPAGERLKSLLLALDELCSRKGIREGGLAIVEATIEEILMQMRPSCCRRTLLYELAKVRKGCRYLTTDPHPGRRGLYSIDFGPIVDDFRRAKSSANAGLHQCKTGAIAPVQKRKTAHVQTSPRAPTASRSQGDPPINGSNGRNTNQSHEHGVDLNSPGGKRNGGWTRPLTRTVLQDPDEVWRLYLFAKRRFGFSHADVDQINFFAAAEHALVEGDEPGALFTSIIRARNWAVIADDDRREATLKLAKRRRDAAPAALQDLVPKMKSPEPDANRVRDRETEMERLRQWEATR